MQPHSHFGGAGLEPALAGERLAFNGLNCYVAGAGQPLLLVHSVNASASAAEVRPLFDHFRGSRRVFALDLPGFGLSDRSDRVYTPALMTEAVLAAAAQIRQQCGAGPVDALGVSLGCEFLARAAANAPAEFRRLAFVSPTGLEGRANRHGAAGSTREIPLMHGLLTKPGWGAWLYRQLTRPAVVRHFLEGSWGSKQIDERLFDYTVKSAQAPGARHAPLYFLSGALFSADIHRVYESLSQPVWMACGTHGDFTDFRAAEKLPRLRLWQQTRFDTGALPFFQRPDQFFQALQRFMPVGQ